MRKEIAVSIVAILLFLATFVCMVGNTTASRTVTLRVRAENDYNIWNVPMDLDVFADGAYQGTLRFALNDDTWTVNSMQVAKGAKTIKLLFARDMFALPGGDTYDLNAYIDWLEYDSTRIQAEDYDRQGGLDGVYFLSAAGHTIIKLLHQRDWAEYDIPRDIHATIDIDPDTLNLKSNGRWITAYISVPGGGNVSNINVSTVQLNSSIPADWGDVQGNIQMVKFDRLAVEDFIGAATPSIGLNVSGKLCNDKNFFGTDYIRAIQNN
jgi:hypothetical protein